MKCPNCGNDAAENAKFCGSCGAPLLTGDQPATTPFNAPNPTPCATNTEAQSAPVPPAGPYAQSAQPTPPESPYRQAQYQPGYVASVYPMTESDKTLRLINFILCVLSAVACCWLIVPLAWMIPMTVISWGIYKGTKRNTVAFGVCTLIFVNAIGGILLLCSTKND